MAYSQIDPRWSQTEVPGSGGAMATEGCYVTAIANILSAAGHDTNPLQVLDALIANGGLNPQGLVIHAKVTEAYPEFVYGGTGYGIVGGTWTTAHGTFSHFIAQTPEGEIDSYYGTPGAPAGFTQSSVQPVGVGQPVAAVEPVPEPAPEVAPEEPSFPLYTVQEGDVLSRIIATHYGLDSWAAIEAKDAEVSQLNGISNPNSISAGQVIKLP